MSGFVETNREEFFEWGKKLDISTKDDDFKVYSSFTYRSVNYSVFDCVYMFREGAKDTDIGKIIKMWENKQGKRVKLLWFFRPTDIRNFLSDYEPSWNELFLASGEGKGVSNIVPLEAIIGKCSVVCTSKDSRNTLPSKSDLGKAEYFFSHIFDVEHLTISEKFPDKIDGVKVIRLFNQDKDKPKANVDCRESVAISARAKDLGRAPQSIGKDSHVGIADTKVCLKDSILKDETSRTSEDFEQRASEYQPLKKRKIRSMEEVDSADLPEQKVEDPTSILDPLPMYSSPSSRKDPPDCFKAHQQGVLVHKETLAPAKNTAGKDNDSAMEISQRPAIDTRRWFNKLPWEESEKSAREQGTLIYLDNLDPSSTSSDIEGMIYMAFKIRVDVKIIPHGSFSNPSYGRALVIFESKANADFVMSELREKCLMVGEGRPIFAYKSALTEPDKPCGFPGHLVIEKLKKIKRSEDKAVSTSHCAQPNTIEYEMAIQWRILQARSDLWWKALHKRQARELLKWQNQLKSRQSNEHAATGKQNHGVQLQLARVS